jgi:hypothetical protein
VNLFRVLLFVAIVAGGAVALYGLLVASSVPLVVAGLAVAGIAAGILGFSLAGAAIRAGEQERMGRAILIAFLGGLFVMGAAGALAGAIVLGILAAA